MAKDRTRQNVLDALERVIRGDARHLNAGYRKSLASVCAEAGISRNALYQGHQDLIKDIHTALASAKIPSNRKRRDVDLLREENSELKRQLSEAMSRNADLLVRVSIAEQHRGLEAVTDTRARNIRR